MQYDDLSHARKRVYNQAIRQTHERRIELHILTLDGQLVRTLTRRLLPGSQVVHDVQGHPVSDGTNPTAIALVKFLDPARTVVFEPDSAGDAPVHRKFMVRLVDSRRVLFPTGWEWIDCDVFTGPIWDFENQAGQVTLTAHGIERLAMGTIRRAKVWRRHTRKTTVLRGLLAAAGAVRMRIPDLRFTTAVHVHVSTRKVKHNGHKVTRHTRHVTGFTTTRTDTYWGKATQLALSLPGRHLYADPSGVFDLRTLPGRPVLHFRATDLLSDVDLRRPAQDGPNTWVVMGGKPKGSKHRVSSGLVGFPAAHPLSAESLAWHGVPHVILAETSNPHLKTVKACKQVARRHRDQAARLLGEVSFDTLPVPWLREYDMVTVETSWGRPTVLMRQWTLPLSSDASPMTIGAVKSVRDRMVTAAGVS